MNYIGSKLKLSSWLKETISGVVGNTEDKIFCDLFAGTGVVGRTFKKSVKNVIANDMEYYAYVLNRNYIQNHKPLRYELIEELNRVEGVEGFIYKNYCLGSGSGRQYFSDENGKKIDAIRVKIEEWFKKREISEDEYFFLLASLIESADKVANTASVYGAFLKHLKKSAQKPLVVEPAFFEINENSHEVFLSDANALIEKIEGDILYLDPPYNQRQYGANYHLLNTIAEYKPFLPKGKTGLRPYKRSKFCQRSEVIEAFYDLVAKAKFDYIFLSYNDEGLMEQRVIQKVMQNFGEYDVVKRGYQRYKANKRDYKKSYTTEYLHILKKRR